MPNNLPPTNIRIIGITRIFEVWDIDVGWKLVSPTELDNGYYDLRVRYTDEDQKFLDKLNKI